MSIIVCGDIRSYTNHSYIVDTVLSLFKRLWYFFTFSQSQQRNLTDRICWLRSDP